MTAWYNYEYTCNLPHGMNTIYCGVIALVESIAIGLLHKIMIFILATCI